MTVNDSSPPEPAPAAMVTSGAALGRAFLPEVAAFWRVACGPDARESLPGAASS